MVVEYKDGLNHSTGSTFWATVIEQRETTERNEQEKVRWKCQRAKVGGEVRNFQVLIISLVIGMFGRFSDLGQLSKPNGK